MDQIRLIGHEDDGRAGGGGGGRVVPAEAEASIIVGAPTAARVQVSGTPTGGETVRAGDGEGVAAPSLCQLLFHAFDVIETLSISYGVDE